MFDAPPDDTPEGAGVSSVGGGRVEDPRSSPGAEPPSGRQHRLVHADQEAVITEVGATLRAYIVDGRPAIVGFDGAQRATHARGQILMPWPGRVGRRPVPVGGGRPPAAHRRARARQRPPRTGSLGQLGGRAGPRRPSGDAPPAAPSRRLPVLPRSGGQLRAGGSRPSGEPVGDQSRRFPGSVRRRRPPLSHARDPADRRLPAHAPGIDRPPHRPPDAPGGPGRGGRHRVRLPGGTPHRADPSQHGVHRPGA